MPTMLGIKGTPPNVRGAKIQPYFVHGIHAITIGVLVEPEVRRREAVREDIRALMANAYAPPTDRIEVLVTGGSQGARILAETTPRALAALPEAVLAIDHRQAAELVPFQ